MRARVTAVRSQTPDTVTVTLRPNDAWTGFEAGQFVRLTVEVDGVRRTRCYSPANSAAGRDGLIELTAKVHDHGVVSTRLHDLRPGTVVTLSPAEGAFTLPAERPAELVLISGGSGITPVLSMLRTLCDEGRRGSVTFLHYSLDARHVLYRARAGRARPGATRRAHRARLHRPGPRRRPPRLLRARPPAAAAPRYAEAEIYVCGPDPLIDAVRDAAAGRAGSDHLHVEAVRTPAPRAGRRPRRGRGDLRVRPQRRPGRDTGATLLDQAEAAGPHPRLGVPHGHLPHLHLRMVCGAARDLRTGELHTAPDCDIQLCVNVPVGDVELLV